MGLRFIGEDPFPKDGAEHPVSRIATIFPRTCTLVTLPGIHATQRLAYLDTLNQQRARQGLPKLTREQEDAETAGAVDLIIEGDGILIRPDPENMPLAFEADEQLQELVPKQRVKFLDVRNQRVHDAIKSHGECWRVTPLPKSPQEMQEMIAASRIGIHGEPIYYYNKTTGTRFLTYREFARLAELDDAGLRRHLTEIRDYSARFNDRGKPEIDFFMADKSLSKADFAPHGFPVLPGHELRAAYEHLGNRFRSAVRPEFRRDQPGNVEWRNAMCAALLGFEHQEVVSEETLLGLSSEFFMQIQWLPGGRIEDGELIFDPVFEATAQVAHDEEMKRLCDDKSRDFIYNFVREYGDLEYVNIGRVIGSLSRRPPMRGRREVYIAQVKQRKSDGEILCIIRMQKWGVREHLDEGCDLLEAMLKADDYTEYVLDRRLGCQQLGMDLPIHATAHRVSERYCGNQTRYHGTPIWSTYFERDYIPGIATDKLPNQQFRNGEFALAFARFMGTAAAPNIIVGRADSDHAHVLFDDGDEVLLFDREGAPTELVVSDPTGAFADYTKDLREAAPSYAAPINSRAKHVPDPREFADVYLDAFVERFSAIQQEYRNRRRAFDTLFRQRKRDEAGSFAYRWERVLRRLESADAKELAAIVRANLAVP